MATRKRRWSALYLFTVIQREEKSLKAYFYHFNKERMTTDGKDE